MARGAAKSAVRSGRHVPGGSGSSNPATRRFRSQVSRSGGRPLKSAAHRGRGVMPGQLTMEALKIHEMDLEPVLGVAERLESHSLDPFAQVRRWSVSANENDREAAAVLAAVTQSITERGMQAVPTAYWAALMTTLETALDDERAATAIIYLLSLIFPRVPCEVLQKQFIMASSVLRMSLTAYGASSTRLVRSGLTCLAVLLGAQEAGVWRESNTFLVLQPLLECSLDTRPKVRRAAQDALAGLASTLAATRPNHPMVQGCFKFCCKQLRSAANKDETILLYVLNVTQSVITCFNADATKEMAEAILRLLNRGSQPMVISSLQVLRTLLQSPEAALPAELYKDILCALFEYIPNIANVQQRAVWNVVMSEGFALLARLNSAAALEFLPQFVLQLLECYLSYKAELGKSATVALKRVVTDCLNHAQAHLETALKFPNTAVHAFIESLRSGLKYRFQAHYPQVLSVLATLLEVLGPLGNPLAAGIVLELMELHATKGVTCKSDIEATLGAAIRWMGPAAFLEIVPLDLASADDAHIRTEFPRSWLLPILRENIAHTQLAYFTTHFIPLASHLLSISEGAQAQDQALIAKTYHTLYSQIWALLPAFCTQAVDLATSFRSIAKVLGIALSQRLELRPPICLALQNAIRSAESAEDRAAVGAFAKNFLPTLFSAFFTAEVDKPVLLATVEAFTPLAAPETLSTMLQSLLQKLAESGPPTAEAQQTQEDLLELLYVLGSAMPAPVQLVQAITPMIMQNSIGSLQKRAYKVLDAVLSSPLKENSDFVQSNLDYIVDQVMGSAMAALPASTHHRLKCIYALVKHLGAGHLMKIVPGNLIVELVMGTKEVNDRARVMAYHVLAAIGERAQELEALGQAGSGLTVEKYFTVVVAGLAGQSAHMISGTILALSRLLFQFRPCLASEQLDTLVEAVLLTLQWKSREVIRSGLGFVKVAIAVLGTEQLQAHLPNLVSSLFACKDETKQTFLSKVKMILERLIRKFGHESIDELTPENHKKLLATMLRVKRRAQRKKAEAKAGRDDVSEKTKPLDVRTVAHRQHQSYEDLMADSEDSDDDERPRGQDRPRASGTGAFLEDNGDDPIDFLDASASHKIRSRLPGQKGKFAEATPFKVAEDGRWMIEDPEEGTRKGSATGATMDTDEEEDGDGGQRTRIGRKRRMQQSDDDDDEDDEDAAAVETAETRTAARSARSGASHKSGGPVRKKGTNRGGQQVGLGAEFRARKAGGDMKKKDMPQPFAYLPFDARQMNKRKQAKALGEMKGMLKGARAGLREANKKNRAAPRNKSHKR